MKVVAPIMEAHLNCDFEHYEPSEPDCYWQHDAAKGDGEFGLRRAQGPDAGILEP